MCVQKLSVFDSMAARQTNKALVRVAAAAMMIVLLVPDRAAAQAVPCTTVVSSLVPCINFLTKGTPKPVPTDSCCQGVQHLNSLATTQQARQSICRCLEQQATVVKPLSSSVSALPTVCKVPFPYSTSLTQDCSKIA